MNARLTEAALQTAFVAACEEELAVPKPGNVHDFAGGHGMFADDFRRSAAAAAPQLCRPRATLGQRILGAVAATRAEVAQNTNLGIVLLCAPLAMAATAGGDLPSALAAPSPPPTSPMPTPPSAPSRWPRRAASAPPGATTCANRRR